MPRRHEFGYVYPWKHFAPRVWFIAILDLERIHRTMLTVIIRKWKGDFLTLKSNPTME